MLKVILWHALGWLLIAPGVGMILGDLMGLETYGEPANLPLGCAALVFGTWAWVRGIRARRARREASA